MVLKDEPHLDDLRAAGWNTRGYLPHFDGQAIPQFITLHLADSIPVKVIDGWKQELEDLDQKKQQMLLQRRIEKYLDNGYGECLLGLSQVAQMVQESLLKFNLDRYKLFAWVIMPNHTHSLYTRSEGWELAQLMKSHKSYTAHEANKLLNRTGQFWMEDYFDRYIRTPEHFRNTIRYIENNPVKAGLCQKPSDWPYSSAWFRARHLTPFD